MSHFDERSGVVTSSTDWGCWYQMLEEVFVIVDVAPGTRGRDVQCTIQPRTLRVVVNGATVIDGELSGLVQPADSLWTLEDGKILQILLMKSDKTAGNCWKSLLSDQYEADPVTHDKMLQKLTLQKIQFGNEGMDFSSSEITGNYKKGCPTIT